ncbi:MAG: alpha/beta hydrolase [Bacteroidales bacterium]|nr:alpha/beta hydrolase [Bacteroidales bacterium]
MRKLGLILCFFVVYGFSVSAQQSVKIWDECPNVTHKHKKSTLTVFLPETRDSSGVSVIICPGGSYYWMARNIEGYAVAKYLNQNGIAAFVLEYRTARKGNHHPAMIDDLERAMHIVKSHGAEWNIAPEKVGVMGFSAGGHLAGTLAIHHTKPEYKPYFVAMIYPVVTMTNEETVHAPSRKNLLGENFSPELAEMLSLEKNIPADMPPVFLLHCTNDKTVDYRNTLDFKQALTEHHVSHQSVWFSQCRKGGHGFGIQPNRKETSWMRGFITWVLHID